MSIDHNREPKGRGSLGRCPPAPSVIGAPVCVDLKTYPAKVEAGKVFINLD